MAENGGMDFLATLLDEGFVSLGVETKLTPMMVQWHKAKNQHPDAILLFRMGDFYELFGDDATTAAPILELALTSRDKDKSGLKMAGFPFHAAESYVEKLVDRGFKVAICDQLEDPKLTRGVVKRGITNVITPGTAVIGESSEIKELAFLVAISTVDDDISLCALDLPTATFQVTSSPSKTKIVNEVIRLSPKELVFLAADRSAEEICNEINRHFKQNNAVRIEKRERILSGVKEKFLAPILNSAENTASLLILSYLTELKGSVPVHVNRPQRYSIEQQLLMDEATRQNLDLLPKRKGDRHNLFSVLNDTKTAMGSRLLQQSIMAPSTCRTEIETRQEMVSELLLTPVIRLQLRDLLASCYDLEKLTALAASNRITPRGMARLRDCLETTHRISSLIQTTNVESLKKMISSLPDLHALREALTAALAEVPPINVKDGGIFKDGFTSELDELRNLVKNGHDLLVALETKEREATSISSLKIKYTRVFGFYIEVTKTHLDKIPPHYRRKQTIANGERYTMPELSELEIKLLSAEAKARELEERKFDEFRQQILDVALPLMETGRTMGLLDLMVSFAQTAADKSLARPVMMDLTARVMNIKDGRHPIIEEICLNDGVYFVPNDILLDGERCSLMLITGPNMAGKSTIMRQAALIQIMAQIGSFVPAKAATLSVCDAIFARVGASDDLATGRSTFMVEMTETAAILANASMNSLIILDEIGRGTSTYDGLSIAQAVAEYIHDHLRTRTLFATHYHELTELEARLLHLKNFHVRVEESTSDIRFLYALGDGPCLKSFGIQVARLSGLPKSILDRAFAVLQALEAKSALNDEKVLLTQPTVDFAPPLGRPQMDLFGNHKGRTVVADDYSDVLNKMLEIDINRLTPLQALNKLASLQNTLRRLPKHFGNDVSHCLE